MCSAGMPRPTIRLLTSRLVDVPTSVRMPPSDAAKHIGISSLDGACARDCFNGPSTAVIHTPTNGSICQRGVQTCDAGGRWGAECVGEVRPDALAQRLYCLPLDELPLRSVQFVQIRTQRLQPHPPDVRAPGHRQRGRQDVAAARARGCRRRPSSRPEQPFGRVEGQLSAERDVQRPARVDPRQAVSAQSFVLRQHAGRQQRRIGRRGSSRRARTSEGRQGGPHGKEVPAGPRGRPA